MHGTQRNIITLYKMINFRLFSKSLQTTISRFMKMAKSFPKKVENTGGKEEIICYKVISPFPAVFSKDLYGRHVKTRVLYEKGLINDPFKS